MKVLLALAILCGLGFSAMGCAPTLAYSGHERAEMIGRTWAIDYGEMQDDIDHFLMLRPPSQMTIWHVR